MFLLLAVLGGAMGWVVMLFEEYRQEYRAASFLIEDRNAFTNTSLYDTEISGSLPRINPRNPSLRKIHLSVQFVELEGVVIDEPAWKALHGLPELEWLFFTDCVVKSTGDEFAGLRSLRVLDISDCRLSREDIRGIATLKKLESLQLGGVDEQVEWMAPSFAELPNLEGLGLVNVTISPQSLRHVFGMRQISNLNLYGATLDLSVMTQLAESENLKSLRLGNTNIDDASLAAVTRLRQIRDLDLSETQITDDGIASLANCESLELLNLSQTKITDETMRYLSRLPELKLLDISHTSVTNLGLEILGESDSLQEYSLLTSGTAIDEVELAKFRKNRP